MDWKSYMQNNEFTEASLANIIRDLENVNGRGFDIYHSEAHRGIIITERGAGLSVANAKVRIDY